MEYFLPIAQVEINIAFIFILSLFVGVLSGLFGVGGGFLMTPFLIFLGIPPAYAVPNEASNILGTSVSGSTTHYLKNTLDYFFFSNRSDGFPNDGVTRFHLGNGAILDRINFCADTSAKALNSSAGIMVNYRYDLSNIDENHQMHFDEKKLNCSKSILLMKKQYQDKKQLFTKRIW